MENKLYAKQMYKCGICESVFETIAERVKCEAACLERQEKEAQAAAEKKKIEEKKARKLELDAAIDKASELLNAYIEDYGSYNARSYRPEDEFEKWIKDTFWLLP